MRAVSTILTGYEPRKDVDRLVADMRRYRTEIRPAYLGRANEPSTRAFGPAWHFLASALKVPYSDRPDAGPQPASGGSSDF